MSEAKKDFLQHKWKSLELKVVLPLWNSEFKSMYESLKLDYNDFVSLAGYELTKAINKFDNSKSNIYTFATNVIKNKARTELRDYHIGNKRRTLSIAQSLNVPVDQENNIEEIDVIEDKIIEIENYLSEERVGEFLKGLSNQQLRIIVLKLLDFDINDIPQILHITRKSLNDALKELKSEHATRPLYRRRF